MARVVVPLTSISRAGVAPATPTTGDATNNHTVSNDGDMFLLVKNTNGASTAHILTIHLSEQVDGQATTPRTYSLAAGASLYLGSFDESEYGTQLLVDVAHAELVISAYHL